MTRRHDIDALRAFAFALVILYHVGMYYVAGWHWHLKSPHAAEWLQWPMRALSAWRMELVFLVAGLALGFAAQGRSGPRLLGQRSLRLLLPLAFGMVAVVPYQAYAQGVANGLVAPGFGAFLLRYFAGERWPAAAFDGADPGLTWNHLWTLPYLWVYTALWIALQPALTSNRSRRFADALAGWRGSALVLLAFVPLALYRMVLAPHFPATHDLLHDHFWHARYGTLFAYGCWLGRAAGLWPELLRLRRRLLVAALLALALHSLVRATWPTPAAALLRDFYGWCALLAILGFAHRWLNHPWRWLPWARESVFPWYVLHQTLTIALAVALAPLGLGPWLEPALVLAGTVLGCWLLTDGVVRRVAWLRPLFGLPAAADKPPRPPGQFRPRARPRCRPPGWPARPAARSACAPGRPCRPGTW